MTAFQSMDMSVVEGRGGQPQYVMYPASEVLTFIFVIICRWQRVDVPLDIVPPPPGCPTMLLGAAQLARLLLKEEMEHYERVLADESCVVV